MLLFWNDISVCSHPKHLQPDTGLTVISVQSHFVFCIMCRIMEITQAFHLSHDRYHPWEFIYFVLTDFPLEKPSQKNEVYFLCRRWQKVKYWTDKEKKPKSIHRWICLSCYAPYWPANSLCVLLVFSPHVQYIIICNYLSVIICLLLNYDLIYDKPCISVLCVSTTHFTILPT